MVDSKTLSSFNMKSKIETKTDKLCFQKDELSCKFRGIDHYLRFRFHKEHHILLTNTDLKKIY
jgi:hypothetical protein